MRLMKINIPTTNLIWPWGGEQIFPTEGTESIGNISSVGYDENNENEIYALAMLSGQFAIGDEVDVGTADKKCFGRIVQ